MASGRGLGLLLVLALQPPHRVLGQTILASVDPRANNSTSQPEGLSQEAVIAISVVFSLLGLLLLAMGLYFLGQKLREKRQTEGTYRPSSEEQSSHAEARGPEDSKAKAARCLPC
ncbi:protein crumbs homolog 3 [Ornithorhynchus anatinus]|uniref:protein crumbs homolog 3 n=1 Tax=Ornithorhynchus anatinus TaxID=9258 RepID=UPI0010A8961C|nr:protein crumbs homolog 3 [Ornithorhynchus anatinus]XP_028908026.1 protein crumbs homolog 3 [Ornithorhynchus anatinus]